MSGAQPDREPSWSRAPVVARMALLLLLPGAFFGLPTSVAIAGALHWLEGELPYRGFWTLYAPGSSALLAGLFALFGKQLIVAAIAGVVVLAAACGALAALLQRCGVGREAAAGAALLFAASQWRIAPTLNTWQPALLLLLLAAERTAAALAAKGDAAVRRRLLIAGLCCGAAAWFKHDVAAYCCFALLIGTFVASRGASGATAVRRCGALLVGAGLVAGSGVLFVAAIGGADAWRDLVLFPLTEFAKSRPEQWPSLVDGWNAASGLVARADAVARAITHDAPLAIALVALLAAWRRRGAWSAAATALVVAAAVATGAWFAAAHVQINTHLDSMTLVALALLAAAGSAAARSGSTAAKTALALVALLYVGALAVEPARAVKRAIELARDGAPLPLRGAAGLRVARRDALTLAPLVGVVQQETRPGEPIYLGVGRHDAVVTSASHLYLLFDRPNATRYSELHPAVVDREPAQREIVAALDAKQVRLIVLWHVGWPAARFDAIRAARARALPGTGATLLDESLARGFTEYARLGEYEIRVRN